MCIFSTVRVRQQCAVAFLRCGWATACVQRRTASGQRPPFAAPPLSSGAPLWGTAAPSGSGAPAPATQHVRVRIRWNDRPPLASLYLWSHAWVPASVVAAPQLQMPGRYHRVQDVVLVVHIKGVGEVFRLAVRRRPRSCQNPWTVIRRVFVTFRKMEDNPTCWCRTTRTLSWSGPPAQKGGRSRRGRLIY